MTKERNPQVHIASASYTVFGKLKSVEESEGYLILTNEDDQQRIKSKKYYGSCAATKAKAETLIGQEIVTMFGGGGVKSPYSPWEYFNDVLYDQKTQDGGLLDVPEDAGPEAKKELVRTRIWWQNENYFRSKDKTSMEQTLDEMKETAERLQVEIRRLEEEREQLTPQQKAELERATEDVEAAMRTWMDGPPQVFGIVGAAYAAKNKLGHIDKMFMLRYGIDVSQRKRVHFDVRKKLRDNFVGGYFIGKGDDEIPMIVSLKKSKHPDVKGQWIIASCDPMEGQQYFSIERKLAPFGGKDIDQPMEHFVKLRQTIENRLRQSQ